MNITDIIVCNSQLLLLSKTIFMFCKENYQKHFPEIPSLHSVKV